MSPPNPAAALPACLLAWLVPGGGHLYLGRHGRGALFLGALALLFTLGLLFKAGLDPHFGFDDPLALIISLGQLALGVPYFVARGLGYGAGQLTAPGYEYGLTFTAVAGLLNLLVILDAYDIAVGRKS